MKTSFMAIAALLACAMLSYGQTDSLRSELQKHPDDIKLKYRLAVAFVGKGNVDTANLLLNEVIRTAVQKNDADNFILAKIQLGRLCADKGENVKAFNHYQEALNKAESISNKESIAHIYKNIGALYISWKKFADALTYYEKAETMAAEVKDEVLVADCQNNKGTVYEQQQKYDKAIIAYKKALDVYTRKNITAKISMALSNVAIVYKFQKNYKASLEYNLKAVDLSLKTGDKWMQAATYNNIGNLYGEMGDYKNAILYCEKGLAIAKAINAIEIVECTYDSMAEAAAKAGDFKGAYNYHRKFSDANSKFINLENTKQLSELNIKFETERKQKLIQKQQFEISRRNYWLYGAIVLLLLMAIVGYLVFRNIRYMQDKRLREEIHKQQEIETRSLFEGEQKERIRIARDLHDSIGQMLSVIKMNLSNIPESETSNITLGLVDSTITEVRNISHNLIPEELNFGLFTALEDMCDKINISNTTQVSISVPDEVREHQFEKTNELSIYRIVQEVLNNMVKHSEASEILIEVLQQQQNFTIAIKDNGKGFDTTQINRSKGLGWKNIAARVNMLDGKMQVRSERLSGTQIEITIPGA